MVPLHLYFGIKIIFKVGQVWKPIKNLSIKAQISNHLKTAILNSFNFTWHLQVKGKVENNSIHSIHPKTTINKFAKNQLGEKKEVDLHLKLNAKSQNKRKNKDTNKERLDWSERQEASRATNFTLVYTSSLFC